MKRMMKTRLGLGLGLMLLLLLLTVTGCNFSSNGNSSENGEKRTVKIGYLPITHAMPLFIEKELAEYEGFNLELIKFGSWPELMDALNTGRIDGASVLITLAMKAKEQGIDLKAVALGHQDGNVLVTAKDIHNVKDLKDKNFAIPHKFSTHNILVYQMLKQNGLQYSDIPAIEMPPAEMPAALSQGRISGYVVAEPFGAASIEADTGKVLYQDNQIWQNSIDCALVLRGEFIEKERDIAQEFVNYYVKAGKQAQLKDAHTFEMSSKYMKANKEVMDISLQWIQFDDLKIYEEDYNELSEALIEMGLQENPPSYEAFVDHSLIEKVK